MAVKGGQVEEVDNHVSPRSQDRGCKLHPSCLECPFPTCRRDPRKDRAEAGVTNIRLAGAFERGVRDRFAKIRLSKSPYPLTDSSARLAWHKGWWAADKWVLSGDYNLPMRVQQVAAMLGLHENTVRRMDGREIHSIRVGSGGHRRFRIQDILNYIEKKNRKVARTRGKRKVLTPAA